MTLVCRVFWLLGEVKNSTPCGARTHDHAVKSRALYLTELRELLGNVTDGGRNLMCGAKGKEDDKTCRQRQY